MGRRVVDMNGLNARLNSLDDETVQELFCVDNAQQLRNLAADISNRTRYLDADAMSNAGTPNILGRLRAAAAANDQIAREYRNGVIGPFLRGENGTAAMVQPDEFVPWLYRKAAPHEARQAVFVAGFGAAYGVPISIEPRDSPGCWDQHRQGST